MKLNQIAQRLPYWYEARKSVYLKSAPGRGKTTVLSSAPERISALTGKKMGLVVINGPLLTPADSIGYLVPQKVTGEDGVQRMESLYTDPFWFRTKEGKRLDEYDGGIILVDEADKADIDVKKVLGEAALSGRLGPHVLPDGWVVWMAGNRQSDRSGSTKELDHLINRRMEIDVTDDVEAWTEWATAAGVQAISIAFVNQNPHIVFSDKVPDKQGPWCTPRSLVAADDYLKVVRKYNGGELPDDAETKEEVMGMIGEAATGQLFAFVQLEREMPKFEDIVADPKGTPVPNKPDASMLVCYNLAHRVKPENIDPVVAYVERLPKEFGVVFGKAACARDMRLLTSKGMSKWVKDNASLMAQIGGAR